MKRQKAINKYIKYKVKETIRIERERNLWTYVLKMCEIQERNKETTYLK